MFLATLFVGFLDRDTDFLNGRRRLWHLDRQTEPAKTLTPNSGLVYLNLGVDQIAPARV